MGTLDQRTLLLLICQGAGVLLLLMTMLLIGLRRIYVDARTGEPIEFEFPVIGKIKTQAPAIVLVLVGAALVVVPLSRPTVQRATLEGDVDTGGKTVTVLVVALPHYEETLTQSGHFSLPLPLIEDATYRVKFIVDKEIVYEQEALLNQRVLKIKPVVWKPSSSPPTQIRTRKDVSDEDLKKLGID
jgi:hypothetical protein